MCGIFGIIGKPNAFLDCLEGLSHLEYRGYDSSGIATIFGNKLMAYKHVGKVAFLRQVIEKEKLKSHIALGHTRWATHGDVNQINAHPHHDQKHSLMIVHNGIIDNHRKIRQELEEQGVKFQTDTDSEVIAQLIAKEYKHDPIDAMIRVMAQLQGSYAIGMIHQEHPDKLFAMCDQMTLSVGLGVGFSGISSDQHAFGKEFDKGFFLQDREIAVLDAKGCYVYDETKELVFRKIQDFDDRDMQVNKEGHKHYMFKEIAEEPLAVSNSFQEHIVKKEGKWQIEKLFDLAEVEILEVEKIELIACGSSYHAALYAEDLFEEIGIPAKAKIASEYRAPKTINTKTLCIAISQSGETADTLTAMKEIRKAGGKVLAICNRMGSTMERNADTMMYMKARVEMSVASTKTYVASMTLMYLLALYLAQEKKLPIDIHEQIEALTALPGAMETIFEQHEKIHEVAKKFAHLNQFLFLGKRNLVFTAMEGALKLKEIAYSFSSAYPAGEMKHGPIALVDEHCLTIALCGHKETFAKMMTSLMEVKTRKSKTLAIVEENMGFVFPEIDSLTLPQIIDALSPFLFAITLHLFAYYIALERKLDIDRPRNLAKSVTVE